MKKPRTSYAVKSTEATYLVSWRVRADSHEAQFGTRDRAYYFADRAVAAFHAGLFGGRVVAVYARAIREDAKRFRAWMKRSAADVQRAIRVRAEGKCVTCKGPHPADREWPECPKCLKDIDG